MTSEQLERFNIFRRSGLNKTGIKKVHLYNSPIVISLRAAQVAAYSDHQMSNGMAQLMSGVGKVFVGEIVAKGTWMLPHESSSHPHGSTRGSVSMEGKRSSHPCSSSRSIQTIQGANRKYWTRKALERKATVPKIDSLPIDCA